MKTIPMNPRPQIDLMIQSGKRVYLSADPTIKAALKDLKTVAQKENNGLEPYVYTPPLYVAIRCKTCGTVNKHHPVTSFCFICNTDNW